jgi:hypothetical protein
MNNIIADILKKNNRFHHFRAVNYKNKTIEECLVCGKSKEHIVNKIKEKHPELTEINNLTINKYYPCLRVIK